MGWWERSDVEVKLRFNSYTPKNLFSPDPIEIRKFQKSQKSNTNNYNTKCMILIVLHIYIFKIQRKEP
jgi:hypothetical protein